MAIADSSLLEHLEPIAKLSAGHRKELAALCKAAEAMYFIKGDLGLRYSDGRKARLRGGTEVTKPH